MQHLRGSNRLLVELGAAPVLTRQDFPYESDLYPFPFELAPLSSVSLAKYTYCEADPVRLGRVRSVSNESVRLVDKMKATLGENSISANHVGKLYDARNKALRAAGEYARAREQKAEIRRLEAREREMRGDH